MQTYFGEYLISDDKALVQIDRVCELLSDTYWAHSRTKETTQTVIDNSFCFGVYKDGVQVAFARCITDYGAIYYLADVVVDKDYRGKGLGKALIRFITEHELFATKYGVLDTRDAHGLYERFGFVRTEPGRYMVRRRSR